MLMQLIDIHWKFCLFYELETFYVAFELVVHSDTY